MARVGLCVDQFGVQQQQQHNMNADTWLKIQPAAPPRSARGTFRAVRSPRVTAQDILREAQSALRPTTTTERGLRVPKGRPPNTPMTPRTSLDVDARAVLARIVSDVPPGPRGFGGKMTYDGDLLTLFPAGTVPKKFLPEDEEEEERKAEEHDIVAKINHSEESAMDCLVGLLAKADETVTKAEKKLAEDTPSMSRASDSFTLTKTDGSHTRGRRQSIMARNPGTLPTAVSDVANLADLDDDADIKDNDAEEAEEDVPAAPLVLPVVQASLSWDDKEGSNDGSLLHPLGRPSADRMQRVLDDGLSSQDEMIEWPQFGVPPNEILQLLRRVRFFRNMQFDNLSIAATWFEVQYLEPQTTVAEEGLWCHSFCMLYAGVVEARGTVYREPGRQHPTSRSCFDGTNGGSFNGGSFNHRAGVPAEPPPQVEEAAAQRTEALANGMELPQPQVRGTHDVLQPILLHPGAHFGEAALATTLLPHTCSIRTMERCVLLVLRRPIIAQQLHELSRTGRQSWKEQVSLYDELFGALAARWRHHAIRRLRVCCQLTRELQQTLENLVQWRIVVPGTTLLRRGEKVRHLYLVIRGTVGLHQLDAAADGTLMGASLRAEEGETAFLSSSFLSQARPGTTASTHANTMASTHPNMTGTFTRSLASSTASWGDNSVELYSDVVGDPLPPLRRRVTEMSDVPLFGEEPLMLPTAAAAAAGAPSTYQVVSRTTCCVAMVPYVKLAKRHSLLAELRKLTGDARARPSALIATLQQPVPLRRGPAKTPRSGGSFRDSGCSSRRRGALPLSISSPGKAQGGRALSQSSALVLAGALPEDAFET